MNNNKLHASVFLFAVSMHSHAADPDWSNNNIGSETSAVKVSVTHVQMPREVPTKPCGSEKDEARPFQFVFCNSGVTQFKRIKILTT